MTSKIIDTECFVVVNNTEMAGPFIQAEVSEGRFINFDFKRPGCKFYFADPRYPRVPEYASDGNGTHPMSNGEINRREMHLQLDRVIDAVVKFRRNNPNDR